MFKKKKQENLAPHEMGPPVEFKAMGGSNQENQANLLQVRQSMGIVSAKELMANIISRRGERVLLDYTQSAVNIRMEVDGLWHQLPAMDRQTGDTMLAVFKKLGNLDYQERRARQDGTFQISFQGVLLNGELTSQGVQTGERVLIKLVPRKDRFATLVDLGMRPKMLEDYHKMVGRAVGTELSPVTKGLIVISAPPNGGGLSTLYSCCLKETDRYMRDFVCIEDAHAKEPEVENVEIKSFDATKGEDPMTELPTVLLKQPDVLVLPNVTNPEVLNLVTKEINLEDRMGFITTRAKETAEAVLRIVAMKPDVQEFAEALTMVVNMRLVRRLCDQCKSPYPPNPQLLQKLGIPAGRVTVLYREFQPPTPGQETPEQLAQMKRNKGQIEVCPQCGGSGYFGRMGIFEMMMVNDEIRQAITSKQKVEVIRELARKNGMRTIQEEGILLLAKGDTSLPELQRVLKS